jgi:hypothetical protein
MNSRLHEAANAGKRRTAHRLIKNSEVIKPGDWIVDESTGVANVDAVGEAVLGYCIEIVTADKIPLASATVDTSSLGGTFVASTGQYTAASDNQTVDSVLCAYVPAREGDRFIATLDAAKGTTTGSNAPGYYVAILTTDSSLLDESSASTSSSNTAFRVEGAYDVGATTEIVVSVHARDRE